MDWKSSVIFEICLLSLELSLRTSFHGALQLLMPITNWFKTTPKYKKTQEFYCDSEYCPMACKTWVKFLVRIKKRTI